MAVNDYLLSWMERHFSTSTKRVAEYGDQVFNENGKLVADYFRTKGIETTSFDLSGRYGAVTADLGEPIPAEYAGKFDAVTNFGTIEHINGQYHAWRNAHIMCRLGGIMLHTLTYPGYWVGHCRYYYPDEFVIDLSGRAGYSIVDMQHYPFGGWPGGDVLLLAALKKTQEEFPSESEFAQLPIHDTGDLTKTGNYIK